MKEWYDKDFAIEDTQYPVLLQYVCRFIIYRNFVRSLTIGHTILCCFLLDRG